MQYIERLKDYLDKFKTYSTNMDFGDVLEIVLISVLVYYILAWMKTTRAWALLKGLVVIVGFMLFAAFMEMKTILWIGEKVLGFAVTALIIVLQPELRKALEELGNKNLLSDFTGRLPFDTRRKAGDGIISEKSINEIAKACVEMGRVRTGALIVIEREESLREYSRTGIDIDAMITSQLLINIFEKNTPLHDGAVIITGNRVSSATCYLPLTDNLTLSKNLGTRHRAAVGISEVTDSVTVIVSEQTGKISLAFEGTLTTDLDQEKLKTMIHQIVKKEPEEQQKEKQKGKLLRMGRSKAKG
ncbi:MAG: diadenylate cyclase CdaA [Lachnospiraceae bacterium]|nr:diadenylate cyclase CdaA [Lachnospiraceae bacterium]MBR4733946.1 diadenylate cyclase CdaA [Lachnospiraceae bacterium]